MRLAYVLLAAALSISAGCGAKKKPVSVDVGRGSMPTAGEGDGTFGANGDAPTGAPEPEMAGANDGNASLGYPQRMDSRELADEGSPVPELPNVFFDFDSFELNESAKAQLAKNAEYLKLHKELSLVLRGHCDERGTEEYNVSLGQRRADAVREYLIGAGVPAERVETISFGKSLPAAAGSDNAVHAKNRRVEFFVYTVK